MKYAVMMLIAILTSAWLNFITTAINRFVAASCEINIIAQFEIKSCHEYHSSQRWIFYV